MKDLGAHESRCWQVDQKLSFAWNQKYYRSINLIFYQMLLNFSFEYYLAIDLKGKFTNQFLRNLSVLDLQVCSTNFQDFRLGEIMLHFALLSFIHDEAC